MPNMPNVWYALATALGLGLLMLLLHLLDGVVHPKRGEIAPVLVGDGDESGEALARMEEGHAQGGAVDRSRDAYDWACKEAWVSLREVKEFYLRCHVRLEEKQSNLLIINGLPADDLQSVLYNKEDGLLIGEVLVGPFDVHDVSWRDVSTAVGKACGVQGEFRRRRIFFSYQPCCCSLVEVEARWLADCLLVDMSKCSNVQYQLVCWLHADNGLSILVSKRSSPTPSECVLHD